MMGQDISKEMRLGELLRALGAVEAHDLNETIRLAEQAGLPLGRALVLSGHLNEEEVDAALELQVLLRRGSINMRIATETFDLVGSGMPLRDALEKTGLYRAVGVRVHPSKLGNLLFDARLISKMQLEEAQRNSYENGMPLGRVLCLKGAITQIQLARALELQRLIRDEKMSHNQAVAELHKTIESAVEPTVARPAARPRRSIKLGEIMMLAGVLTENDIMNALEYGLTSTKPLGDVLVDLGLVTREVISLALELQQSIASGDLNVLAATDVLSYVASLRENEKPTVDDLQLVLDAGMRPGYGEDGNTVRLGELLKMCGFIEEKDIVQAIELSSKHPVLIGKMLVVSGALVEGDLLSALRCQFLLRNGHITVEQAVRGLQFAKAHHLNLDDALDELGILLPHRS